MGRAQKGKMSEVGEGKEGNAWKACELVGKDLLD